MKAATLTAEQALEGQPDGDAGAQGWGVEVEVGRDSGLAIISNAFASPLLPLSGATSLLTSGFFRAPPGELPRGEMQSISAISAEEAAAQMDAGVVTARVDLVVARRLLRSDVATGLLQTISPTAEADGKRDVSPRGHRRIPMGLRQAAAVRVLLALCRMPSCRDQERLA